jgi:polyhydroxybutyrate depolymerase
MLARYPVDPKRIYATGFSNGGGMVNRLGCDLADRFAAIAPVSGAFLLSEDCRPSRPIPVMAFHGTGDRIVPYDGSGKVLPPIPAWAAGWALRNGCRQPSTAFLDDGVVRGEHWSDCEQGADVFLYTIAAGGHTWPGRISLPGQSSIDASATMWGFFQTHPMP